MEQKTGSSIFGRKIFFVNPSMYIERNLVEKLRALEYEVYIIRDYKNTKGMLKKYKDAMCFIFIDTALTYEQWYKFLKTVEIDEELTGSFIGLLSREISEKRKDFFLKNTVLAGGLTKTDVPVEDLFTQFKKILDDNEAKGKRQYIRLDCEKIKDVNAYLALGTKLFIIDVNNISTTGIAIKTIPDLAPAFKPNSEVYNISLSIKRHSFVISGVVYHSSIESGFLNAVILLGKLNDKEQDIIRKFIFGELDKRISVDLDTCLKDTKNYETYKLPENFVPYRSK